MADATDLKSVLANREVWVRIPSSAPSKTRFHEKRIMSKDRLSSCAARQVPRDFSPQVAERGAQQDSRSGNMKIYMTRMIASSQAGVELRERYLIRSLARDSSLSRAVARIHWRTRI